MINFTLFSCYSSWRECIWGQTRCEFGKCTYLHI